MSYTLSWPVLFIFILTLFKLFIHCVEKILDVSLSQILLLSCVTVNLKKL